jgi:1-acyl-sn-glycerol-3-phosphate acyltransferase
MSAISKKNKKQDVETQTPATEPERERCPHCKRLMPKSRIMDPEKRSKLEEQLAKLAEREAKLKARLGIPVAPVVETSSDESMA